MHELSRQVTVNATEQFSPLIPATRLRSVRATAGSSPPKRGARRRKAGIQNLLLAWVPACAGTSGRYFTSAHDAPLLRVSAGKSS